MAGWMPTDESGRLSLAFVVTLSAADTIILIGLMVLLTVARGERVSELWLGTRPLGREAGLGALLVPVGSSSSYCC